MEIKKCTLEDVPQLALFNKQLIEDEKSNNPIKDAFVLCLIG